MGQISHLSKRGSVYYARMDVPEDLVPILNTQTRKLSLKTKDFAEAKKRLWPVIVQWQREFEDLRTRRRLTEADREHAVWDHYKAVLERDDTERSNMPKKTEIEEIKANLLSRVERGEVVGIDPLNIFDATLELKMAQNAGQLSTGARKAKLAEMRKHLAKGETVLIAHEVDEYLRSNRLFVDQSMPEWDALARRMMRAEIQALERTLERDQGNFAGQPLDALVTPPSLDRRADTEVAAAGESIMDAVEAFKTENPRNVSAGRMNESCRDIGIFIETVGPTFPIAKITKKHVREWKALLIVDFHPELSRFFHREVSHL